MFPTNSDTAGVARRLKGLLRGLQTIHVCTHLLKTFAVWCLLALTIRGRWGWTSVHLIAMANFMVFLLRDPPLGRSSLAVLERLRPDSDFRFTTVFECARRKECPSSPAWETLLMQTRELLSRPTPVLDFPGLAFAFRASALVTCATILLMLFFPPADQSVLGLHEMLRVKVPAEPVLAGSDVHVRVFSEGRMGMHRLHVKLAGATDAEAPSVIALKRGPSVNILEADLQGVTADLRLKAVAILPGGPEISSPEAILHVIRPPTLAFRSALLTPPAYTQLPPEEVKTVGGKFQVYPGTEMDLRLESDIPVSSATAAFSSAGIGRPPALKSEWRGREIQITGKFLTPGRLDVRAVSPAGLTSAVSAFDVDTLIDRHPSVAWLIPGRMELEAPVEGLVPLRWLVEDDFGLSGFSVLVRQAAGETAKQIDIAFLPQRRQEISHLLDITPYLSYPGAEIEIRAEAKDNDRVAGPKSGQSESLRIRAPTVMDVYKRLSEQGSEVGRVMERLSGESTRLLKKMTAAARTMKAEGKMAWQMERELVTMAESTRQAKEDAEKALAELGKRTQAAAGQGLLSRETLQKLSSIGNMLTQLLKDDYVRAQREMERALGTVRLDEKERAMMSAKFNLEQFVEQVDRTHRMLSRVSEVMLQSEAMKAMQDLAKHAEEALAGKDAQHLSALAKDAAAVMPKLQELAKNPAFADLKKALASGAADLQKQFEKAAQAMSAPASDREAAEAEQKLKKSIAALQTALQEGSEKSESAEKQNAASKLNTLIDDIIFSMGRLQASHEYFLNARGSRDPVTHPKHLRKSAAIEPILEHAVSEISAIAERLILFDPRPIRFLRTATAALRSLAERDEEPAFLAVQLKTAYRFSALAAIHLLDTSRQLQKQGSGKGKGTPVQDLAELLQQLISAQSSVNARTQSLMQMGLFGNQLEQMAFQQELIRRSMEAEAGRFSELQEKLGRIDQLLQDMRKTEDDMRRMGPTKDIQAQQQKILNKLMELQQSLTDKEEKEDKFEAEPFFGKPADTSTLRLDRPRVDEKEFLRALPPEYRDAGKKYLRAILGEERP